MTERPKCIIHVDADAFFASVEQKDHPEYRGKPLIVGHDPKGRGVVSTCSYEARKFGVHSAMPISQAYRLCPHAIFVRPRMERYKEISQKMFSIMEKYTPLIEQVSIDEAYLDVTGENGVRIASSIRRQVRDTLGITVTAGVSYCKYLAKIASDSAKPDGLLVITPTDADSFLLNLEVSRLPGIGPKTTAKLEGMGIRLVSQLRQMPEEWFLATFGKMGPRIKDLCFGKDLNEVQPTREVKSISEETTFQRDVSDKETLRACLAKLCENVAFRLRKGGFKSKVLGIKVRFSDFHTITREHALPEGVSSDAEVYGNTKPLLQRLSLPKPVRLLGVFARGLKVENPVQPRLFDEGPDPWDQVSRSMDLLRMKYGKPVVFLGACVTQVRSKNSK